MYKMLLFDFDGVLSNSLTVCIEELNALRTIYPTIPEIVSKSDMTRIYSGRLKDAFVQFGLSREETKQFFYYHSMAMLKRAEEIDPFFAILDAVRLIDLPKALITSSTANAIDLVLRKSKFTSSDFGFYDILSKELPGKKPEKIKFILDKYGLSSREVLYCGDLASDILYCQDAGIDIIAVGDGYHPSSYLQLFHPTYLVDSEDEFIHFLGRHFS